MQCSPNCIYTYIKTPRTNPALPSPRRCVQCNAMQPTCHYHATPHIVIRCAAKKKKPPVIVRYINQQAVWWQSKSKS